MIIRSEDWSQLENHQEGTSCMPILVRFDPKDAKVPTRFFGRGSRLASLLTKRQSDQGKLARGWLQVRRIGILGRRTIA